MTRRNPGAWIWGEAVDLLEQAERLQRQFFRLGSAQRPSWEPPADVYGDQLEIPHGRFERRLALPPGRWELVAQELANGCLQLLLARR